MFHRAGYPDSKEAAESMKVEAEAQLADTQHEKEVSAAEAYWSEQANRRIGIASKQISVFTATPELTLRRSLVGLLNIVRQCSEASVLPKDKPGRTLQRTTCVHAGKFLNGTLELSGLKISHAQRCAIFNTIRSRPVHLCVLRHIGSKEKKLIG